MLKNYSGRGKTHATKRTNFENIRRTEISQTQSDKDCTIPPTGNGTRRGRVLAWGTGGGRRSYCLAGAGCLFGKMKSSRDDGDDG